MTIPVATVLLAAVLTGPGVADSPGEARREKVDELKFLRAQARLLKESVKRLQHKNEQLAREVQRLRELCKEAGIDTRRRKVALTTRLGKTPARGGMKDRNTKVVKALHEYVAAVGKVSESDDTDIQKRTTMLKAMKALDAVLRRSRVTISFTVEDVQVDSRRKRILISPASASIKTADPNVGDFGFVRFRHIYLSGKERGATKITKESTVEVVGMLALGVDLSKPAARQPARWKLPGYEVLGEIGAYYRGYRRVMVRKGYSVVVDGVRRIPSP